jgi:hypothetical protein
LCSLIRRDLEIYFFQLEAAEKDPWKPKQAQEGFAQTEGPGLSLRNKAKEDEK